jgi:arylsulfatase
MKRSVLLGLVIVAAVVARFSLPAATHSRPNILILLSDDVGYSDIGCYGGEIHTPNLDALARDGIRFTQFYNTARCCPTRASLLTGLHPHQAGVGHMMEDRGLPGYKGRLNRQCVTLAEALKPAGYRSYAVGKWHVTPGHGPRVLTETDNWPLQRGFDRFYGTIHGAGSYFDPSSLVRDNRLLTVANDPDYRPAEYYYTDAIAEHAVRFIRDHSRDQKNQPFLLYTAFTAAHWPLHAKEADIAKYKGRYDAGYEPVRAARRAKLRQLGLLDDRWAPVSPSESWDKVSDKAFESRCMEVYAAQLDAMDQGIGRIVAELKAHGQLDNTLILYLQDNGGCAEGNGRGNKPTARASQPTLPPMSPDDPQYDSQPKQTRDGYPVRQGIGVLPGGPDTYIAYGRGWANVSGTPFREYKHWTHEGGIATPLIVHWPAGIAADRKGRLEPQPGQLVDIMATCVDLAGATYPAHFAGETIQPMEGTSLRPAFRGDPLQRTRPLVWEHEGNRAIRDGQWKLVAKENQPWELYDLDADRPESNNLATRHPDRILRMSAEWDSWAARAHVLPLGAWRGK